MKSMQFSLAPEKLLQTINPWTFNFQNGSFGLVNINMGITPKPEVEQEVLDKVGSYGRQIGWLSEVVEILLAHTDRSKFTPEQARTIRIFEGRLAEIDEIKDRHGADTSPASFPAKTAASRAGN